ncbi:MAG: glycosyltransferase [Alteromonadaceae bacterium]|nr:glycosyltransferase [Alteromonadaceae bacterium]
MGKHKVLFVHKFFTVGGGVERVHKNLSVALGEAGVDSIFYVHDKTGESAEGFARLQQDYSAFAADDSTSLTGKLRYLFSLIKRKEINVLIAATETANMLALLCKIRYPALSVVYTRHCAFDVSDQKLPPWAIKSLYAMYSITNGKIVAVSEALKKQIQNTLLFGKSKVKFIPNAVLQPAILELANKAPEVELPERYFCSVGRLVEQKGFDLLLQAYAKAYSYDNSLPELVIVGAGEDLDKLKSHASQLGIQQRVHFTGFTTNPYSIIQAADAFILSSRHEGMPTVLVEAMYLNTPVIAFDCPTGPSELITPNETGILVKALDTDDLATAMQNYSVLKAKPLADSVKHFSYENVATAYISQFG